MFRTLLKMMLLVYLVAFTFSVKALLAYMYLQHPAEFMYRVETYVFPAFAGLIDTQTHTWLTQSLEPVVELAPGTEAAAKTVATDKSTDAGKPLLRQQEQQLAQEILTLFGSWQPLPAKQALTAVELDGTSYANLAGAIKHLKDNSVLRLPTGIYQQPLHIQHHNVTIEGVGHVVFENAAIQGKGYILASGNDLTVRNIECRFIKVDSKNGACVRLEGRGLVLDHVYFHSSETGLLETAKQHGFVQINNSRFENLAANAHAHSIYLNKASLYMVDSLILANRRQHSLKSRGPRTVIDSSILAELSAPASRLIDISNGGELVISRSLLHKGPNSVNNQVIGFGLEGLTYSTNQVTIENSLLLLDRPNSNYIVHSGNSKPVKQIENNVIVASDEDYVGNINLKNRVELHLAAYPAMPLMLCHLQHCKENIRTEPD